MIDPQVRLEELIEKLKQRGSRLTPQRLAILKVFVTSSEHLSAEQVYERVKPDFPTTSLATVYKTVVLLKELGEILELGFSCDGNRYDGQNPLPHPHLICVQCKEIIDPDIENIEELVHQVSQKYGYQSAGYRLDFYGICPKCRGSQRAAPN